MEPQASPDASAPEDCRDRKGRPVTIGTLTSAALAALSASCLAATASSAINPSLSSVSCPAASNCMAVGDFLGLGNGMALAEPWNGTRWSIVTTPQP